MSIKNPHEQAQKARALLARSEQIVSEAEVQAAVDKIATALNQRFDNEAHPVLPLVLSIMGGAVIFTGQLLPRLTFPLEFDYIHVTRYGREDKGGTVEWKVEPHASLLGRTIIVLDDILDEGETLAHVKHRLLAMGAGEVILAIFADKDIGKSKPVTPDYVGVTLPNRFVVGFGMDAYGYWRNLPAIWAITPSTDNQ